MSIQLTERAAEHIRTTLAAKPGAVGLRLGVKTKGCTGFVYTVEVAQQVEPTDQVIEQHGVNILIDSESLPIITGTQVDFVHKGLSRSFEFNNPNAEHYCGCGESFSVKTNTGSPQ